MKLTDKHSSEVSDMLNSYYTENIIGLQDVIVKEIVETEEVVKIILEEELQESECPCCHSKTKRVHDYRSQTVQDLPAFGRKVILVIRRRRYSCRCGKHFYRPLSFLPKYQRRTQRTTLNILKELAEVKSYSSVAKNYDLSKSTVIRIFDNISYPKPKELPMALGIDEFKGNTGKSKYNAILTDLENGKVIDILRTRNKVDLITYFKGYDRSKVKYLVSDMYGVYKEIAETFFPKATYIIDRYHWVRQCIWAFETVRKDIQKEVSKEFRIYFKHSRHILIKHAKKLKEEESDRVNVMLFASPNLSNAYYLKEQLYAISEEHDISKRKYLLKQWIRDARDSEIPSFKRCAETYVRWFEPIVNSLNHPYSNGFTEGCNNKIKVLKRNAFGLSKFKRFRNRILYCMSREA